MSTLTLPLKEKPVDQETPDWSAADLLSANPGESARGVNCPRCQSLDTKQSSAKGPADWIAAAFGLKHFRCNRCFRRFRSYLRGL